ncbi:hypothetical protein QR680_000783 [Steinernema hermaphroditum]|uniref:Uncharacterized protein n=1 Tax=Steinernema hermaphroditum TaxID=289476 RepID=A0AA39LE88_9BILA|nr:hypothetical protein QR680_000783 [Steinernema hermaphroditum]
MSDYLQRNLEMLSKTVFVAAVLVSGVVTIKCYFKDSKGVTVEDPSDYAFCVFQPAREDEVDRAYGLKADDHPTIADPAQEVQTLLGDSSPLYRVISICMAEVRVSTTAAL